MLLQIFQSSICTRFYCCYCCYCCFLFLLDCLLLLCLVLSFLLFLFFISQEDQRVIILKMQIIPREIIGPFDFFKYCSFVLFVTTGTTFKICFVMLARFYGFRSSIFGILVYFLYVSCLLL